MTMRRNLVGLLVFVAALDMAKATSPTVSILSPPDGFFASGDTLEVEVAYDGASRRGRLFLRLLVNGVEVQAISLPTEDKRGTLVLHVPISGPIGLVQAVLVRGRSDHAESTATVRGAGLADAQRLRATMEEMEEMGTAILQYRQLLNYPVPGDLEVLVPAFLAELPVRSPLGPPYEYETDGAHFSIRVALPGQGEILLQDGTFVAFPPGAITDREAARLTRETLTRLATAMEAYRIDNNLYPQNLDDLVPVFLPAVPARDPHGNAFVAELSLASYRLASLGADGQGGGVGFDADTIFETGVFLATSSRYRGQREYVEKAAQNLSSLYAPLLHVADQNGELPETLAEVEPFVGRGALFDLCGNPYRYEVRPGTGGEHTFFLSATGCDGVPYTDATERSISGSYPRRCSDRAVLWLPLFPPGLFD